MISDVNVIFFSVSNGFEIIVVQVIMLQSYVKQKGDGHCIVAAIVRFPPRSKTSGFIRSSSLARIRQTSQRYSRLITSVYLAVQKTRELYNLRVERFCKTPTTARVYAERSRRSPKTDDEKKSIEQLM